MHNPKSILITGASSGIGEALAVGYAGSGVYLFLSGRNTKRLESIGERCRELGAEVECAVIDVTDERRMREWVVACDRVRGLELVIANAGISNAGEVRSEEFERDIFAVNLFGVLNTVYPAIEVMRQRGRGQIAIMSSLAAMHGFPRAPVYCASKSAVKVFGEALRSKLRRYNIAVSVICPGFIKTPLTDLNDFSMPFMMSVTKAAQIIIKALAKDCGLIAFPLRLYSLLWLLKILPYSLAQRIASKI